MQGKKPSGLMFWWSHQAINSNEAGRGSCYSLEKFDRDGTSQKTESQGMNQKMLPVFLHNQQKNNMQKRKEIDPITNQEHIDSYTSEHTGYSVWLQPGMSDRERKTNTQKVLHKRKTLCINIIVKL